MMGVAPWGRGEGLTQKNTGVRSRCLCVDLSACPPRPQGKSGVSAPSGCDLIGALASQHRECTVHRFLPEPRDKSSAPEEVVVVSGSRVDVFGGVDTHRDTHVAAVVDTAGRVLGSESFGAEGAGYQQLVAWLGSQGHLVRVGVEGTGSYGAGLARYLTEADIEVVEVNRPNRQLRRQKGGKTDSVDAEAAARAAASGQATAVPKSGVGPVECIRMLLVARRSAVKARTQAANQIHSVVVTAPEQVKHQLKGMNLKARVRVCARFRPSGDSCVSYAKLALRHLARRYQTLDTEIAQLDTEIRGLCAEANPALLAAKGVGPDTAAALLVAVGDNPGRMKSERSFAALCGSSPVQASSGQTIRHRLNRGGNRQANCALWRIATTRMRHDARTKDYVTRRQAEGKNRKEIIRCLKRHIAREIYRLLTNPPPTPNCAKLRSRRQQGGITISQAAQALRTHTARISEIERGRNHNHQLATRYQNWLRTREPAPSPI